MATLYLVSTPIGNLADITARAVEVLGSVDGILAEDTRRTRVLLDHLGLDTPLTSLHEHNEASRTASVLERLDDGQDLALLTDAGTPLVSDPGSRLARSVIDAGHSLVPIPGPSAVLAALVASGLPAAPFVFLGFPPRRGPERRRLLERVGESEETAVLFESPGRLVRLLRDLSEVAGPERRTAVGRELTKLHEEFFRGTLGEAQRYYRGSPPRGEVTLVVAPAPPMEAVGGEASRARAADSPGMEAGGAGPGAAEPVDEEAARVLGRTLLDRGTSPSRAAREVARRLGVPRNAAYRIVQSLQHQADGEP